MKTRQGYVSNSSSSSFIVAGKENFTIKIEIPISKYADRTITNVSELHDYINNRYEYCDNEYKLSIYNKCVKELEKNNVIYVGDFDNQSGDCVEAMLCDEGIPLQDNITIIENEAGF